MEDIGSGKYTSAEQILTQMSNWGYADFVRQERERMIAYEAMISSIVQEFARPAFRPEEQATQALASQQMAVPAIIASIQDLVQETWQKIQDERQYEAGERNSPRDSDPVAQEIKKEVEGVVKLTTNDFAEKGVDGVIRDPGFQNLFSDARAEELRPLLMSGAVVPQKITPALSEAASGSKSVNVSQMDPAVQLALVRAYRKALEAYKTNNLRSPREGQAG